MTPKCLQVFTSPAPFLYLLSGSITMRERVPQPEDEEEIWQMVRRANQDPELQRIEGQVEVEEEVERAEEQVTLMKLSSEWTGRVLMITITLDWTPN